MTLHAASPPLASPPTTQPLYQRLASHYRGAIHAGSLVPGDRMPSLRGLMRQHDISLSTAMQLSRHLESEGWLEARPRSGYFVRRPARSTLAAVVEPHMNVTPDPAQFVGIHARVSDFIARGRLYPAKTNLATARCAPELYPAEALNLALRAVSQPGDTIAVESPTFYGLLQVLESLGLRALEIPTSPQTGISIDALELAIQTYNNIKAVVVVPHLQNPLGSIMPDANKQRLVELCEATAIPLIEDDTYSELVNEPARGEAPLRAMKSWDRNGNVIYCASLHKILAPGLRVGWMMPGRWQARVEMLKYTQTRSNEDLSQLTAAAYMASPAYDRHLRRLRSTLQGQREKTAEAIARFFPPGTRLNLPQGGLSLWVALPGNVSSKQVFDVALQEQILITPGLMFSNSLRFDAYLRINCGWPYGQEVEHALQRLGQIVGTLLDAPAYA